jgi:hypothetical protein
MKRTKEIEDLKRHYNLSAEKVVFLEILAIAEESGTTYEEEKWKIIENKK